MPQITFSELVDKVQSGSISRKEVNEFFDLDGLSSKAFAPRLALRRDAVDVSGVERTAGQVQHVLGLDAARAARRNELAATGSTDQGPFAFVGEGDSWFSHPLNTTIIDVLRFERGYKIDNYAEAGDTLENMILSQQYAPDIAEGTVRYLLFSGGGNDVLGDRFEECLNLYDPLRNQPSDASYYVKDLFLAQLRMVEEQFKALIHQVALLSHRTKIVVHGYDYARPGVNGPYLGVHMQNRGLYPLERPALCNAIVKVMVDLFNKRLSFLAQHAPNFIYVDFRGKVRASEWFDELHPKPVAARRLAALMAAILGPPLDAIA